MLRQLFALGPWLPCSAAAIAACSPSPIYDERCFMNTYIYIYIYRERERIVVLDLFQMQLIINRHEIAK